jgi:hypothetical protein
MDINPMNPDIRALLEDPATGSTKAIIAEATSYRVESVVNQTERNIYHFEILPEDQARIKALELAVAAGQRLFRDKQTDEGIVRTAAVFADFIRDGIVPPEPGPEIEGEGS